MSLPPETTTHSKTCTLPVDEPYAPTPVGSHVMTPEQAEAFDRRQAEPPRQPTEAEREAVRAYRAMVKR